jgi:hypothetical protein
LEVEAAERLDGFGNPLQNCEWWCCNEWFRPVKGKSFCSRACKQANRKKKIRRADPNRPLRIEHARKEGYEEGDLYIIQAGDVPIVKVGYSKNWKTRLRVLKTGHYEEMRTLAVIPTRRYFKQDAPDKDLHMLLNDEDCVRGEWYKLNSDTYKVLLDYGFDLEYLGTV